MEDAAGHIQTIGVGASDTSVAVRKCLERRLPLSSVFGFQAVNLWIERTGSTRGIAPKIALDKIEMQCKDRSSLLAHYQKRVRAYSHAVSELRQERATISQDEFKRLWNITELALRACAASQRSLERHMVDHRCDVENAIFETKSA